MRKRGAYLDNASTSCPKPACVWESCRDFLKDTGASPGRAGYRRARESDALVTRTRESLAALLGADRPHHIAFTSNATSALNTCIKGTLRPGDRVVTTSTEHNSVLRPLERLSRAGVITYRTESPEPNGCFDLSALERAVSEGCALVVVNHASNVTGAVAPVPDIARIAHRYGAKILVDASQSAGFLDIDIAGWDLDMLVFTGHKCLLGPSGTGGMYLRDPENMDTLMEGGTGSNSRFLLHPKAMPARFEAGTLNYLGIAGLGASVDYVRERQPELREHGQGLLRRAVDALAEMPAVQLQLPAPEVHGVPVLSFTVRGLYPSEVAAVLDERFDIATRAGLHCAPRMHEVLGTAPHGTVRASFGALTTDADAAHFIDAMAEISAECLADTH